MKRLVCSVALLLAPISLSAQGFLQVHTRDGSDVWAVGNSGNVFRSFDGGATWGSYPLGGSTLRSVAVRGTHVHVIGDGGTYYRSTNNGESFALQTLSGGTELLSISFTSDSIGWVGGNNGTLLKTTTAGSSWVAVSSPTTQHIRALKFTDPANGWFAGTKGMVMKTTNGGTSWSSISPPGVTTDLRDLDLFGSTLYVVGERGIAAKSTNSGTTWSILNFKLDTRSDILDVTAQSTTTAYFCGGGGFIRKTVDGGSTYQFLENPMMADLVDIFFYDSQKGWAVSSKNNAILRTTDGGTTWSLPTGTTVSTSWSQKLSASSSIGNTLVVNSLERNHLYVALGRFIYMSGDRGETWSLTATISSTSGNTHSFYISPKDTNIYVVAFTGGGDKIMHSTNRGVSWTTTIARNFTSYGMPLEMHPDRPDTLLFAPDGTGSGGSNADGVLYRSTNFGATWDTLSSTTSFRSPCDIVIVPDSANIVYVGDGITGSGRGRIFRSTNSGVTWAYIDSVTGSEIPTISVSRHQNSTAYATAWSSGGVKKTGNFGTSWPQVATTSSAWGTDIAKDDPNVVIYGSYGTGDSYVSTNGGTSFTWTNNTGSNYAYLAYDRGNLFAQQSGGVWKYNVVYTVPVNNTQIVDLLSPNGGEVWQAESAYNITWSSSQISNVKIEYKTAPGNPWNLITSSTAATTGSYLWTLPHASTTEARIRVTDAADGTPIDSSAAYFTMTSATMTMNVDSIAFGIVVVGTPRVDTLTITNNGNGTLVISSVTTATGYFVPSRTSFSIPAGLSDTLKVIFTPTEEITYVDTLVFLNNAEGLARRIPLSGIGSEEGLPIQLASFTGWFENNEVQLEWVTLSEINNYGFEVQISVEDSTSYYSIPNVFIPGHGTTNIPQTYRYAHAAPPFSAYYRLKQIDLTGEIWYSDGIKVHTVTGVVSTLPTDFALHQSYPNPFNPMSVIPYDVAETGHVLLEVFDMLGRKVATLVDEVRQPGRYKISFDATGLASGVYLYRLAAKDYIGMRRMVLMK